MVAGPGAVSRASATVYLEDSPAAQDVADEAESHAREGRWGEAAAGFQRLIEEFPHKLMPGPDESYTDAVRWAERRLAEEPALLAAYRRRYGPEAERALDRAREMAGGWPAETDAVVAVWRRYALTSAGLEAALWLAGQRVERADAAGSGSVLEAVAGHTDLPGRAAEYHRLRAWTAALADDAEARQAAVSAWRGHGDGDDDGPSSEWVDALERLAAASSAAAGGAGSSAEPPSLEKPLWFTRLAPNPDRSRNLLTSRGVNPRNREATDLRPVAAGGLIFINDNQRVVASDALSGRLRWTYRPAAAEQAETDRRVRMARVSQVVPDEREVSVRGDAVYAVLGELLPWQGRRRNAVISRTHLTCLDRETGELRWSVQAEDLDPSLGRTTFHGTPVLRGGQLLVMARRGQASSFQDSYLIAVDPADGTLRWRRHLSSTARPNNRNRPAALSSMTLDGELVYITDNLGAVAAVEARSGTVRWARVIPQASPPKPGRAAKTAQPFSRRTAPLVCRAGLLLPLHLDGASGLVLDPASGQVRERLGLKPLMRNVTDLFPLPGGDVLAVGVWSDPESEDKQQKWPGVKRLNGENFETQWVHLDRNTSDPLPPRVVYDRSGDTLLVAHAHQPFYQLDAATGRVATEATLPWRGVVIRAGNAWVLSDGANSAGFMDWPTAYAELQARLGRPDAGTDAGLDLARLAVEANEPGALLEGVEHVIQAMSRSDSDFSISAGPPRSAQRSEAFRELYALTRRHEDIGTEAITRVFDRLATITQSPEELLGYHLAQGRFYEAVGQTTKATGLYQAVLLDPAQAQARVVTLGTSRRGGLAARQRLEKLKENGGEGFYDEFERRARQEYAAALRDPSGGTEALLAIAERYPLAAIAPEAIFAAAQRQADEPAHPAAITQYRRAFQLAQDTDLRRRAAGALTTYYESQGRPAAAATWLEQVIRDHPRLTPVRDGVPIDPTGWIAELRSRSETSARRPRVGPPFGPTWDLAGALFPATEYVGASSRLDAFLIVPADRRAGAALYESGRRDASWITFLPERDLTLAHLGRDNLLLWSAETGRLYGLDAATGRPSWPAIAVGPLLTELGEGGLAGARRVHAGAVLDVIEAEFGGQEQVRLDREIAAAAEAEAGVARVVAGQGVALVIDGRGRAAGIDRYTGRALWQNALPIDLFTDAAIGEDVVAVAGLAAPGGETQAGRVMLVDLVTGRLRFLPIEDREAIVWLGFSPSGDLAVATASRVSLYGRRDGGLRWRVPLSEFTGEPRILATDEALFLADNARLSAVDLKAGRLTPSIVNTLARGVLISGGDRLLHLTPQDVTAISKDLTLSWRDAIELDPKRLLYHAAERDHVLVVTQPAPEAENAGVRLFAIERRTGRIVAESVIGGFSPSRPPTDLRPMDGQVLITSRGRITVVPGAAFPAEPTTDPGTP